VTAACSKCRTRQLPGEDWTRNGDGLLCERCSPNGTVKGGVGGGRGLGGGLGLGTPSVPPSSSSSFHDEDPPLVEWLLREHRAGRRQPEPVPLPHVATLPANAQAVAVFFATVHGLRLTTSALGARPVPFGVRVGRAASRHV
jgi:hypothetical protein